MAKRRAEVAVEDCWDVGALYRDNAAWEQEFAEVEGEAKGVRWPHLVALRGKLGDGPEAVRDFLQQMLSLVRRLEKLYVYAHLRNDEDLGHAEYKQMYGRARALLHHFGEETCWFEPELLDLPTAQLEAYLQVEELQPYRFLLEKIVRRKPHTLPAREEELIAMAAKPLGAAATCFSVMENADFRFTPVVDGGGEEHELTLGSYSLHLRSRDRLRRENAFISMQGKFQEFGNTCCELLQGSMSSQWFDARAHHFPSTLEAALFGNAIDPEVYDSLVGSVREGVEPLHRYLALRKRLLGLKELKPYDLYVPLVEWERDFSYEEAEQLVIESVKPLGEEYQALVKKGLCTDRWVDRFENQGKRSGGYSSGCYDSHPYILMNFSGTLNDVYTLAHEVGHSMHSLLSRKHQPYHDADYSIFVAEVASTFNEELLSDLLLERSESRLERAYLVHQRLEGIRATLFRQTLFADFERCTREQVERNQPLTPQTLCEQYTQLNRLYYGPDLNFEELASFEWARIPHFYYRYYVYQYATGISAALALHKRVSEGGEQEREEYLGFLKSGGSAYPLDVLCKAGVDMRKPAPVKAAMEKFAALVAELEELLG